MNGCDFSLKCLVWAATASLSCQTGRISKTLAVGFCLFGMSLSAAWAEDAVLRGFTVLGTGAKPGWL